METERFKVTLEPELVEKIDSLSAEFKELDENSRVTALSGLVYASSDDPTVDLQVAVNIIVNALRLFENKDRKLSILKQTLEGTMEIVHKEMNNE